MSRYSFGPIFMYAEAHICAITLGVMANFRRFWPVAFCVKVKSTFNVSRPNTTCRTDTEHALPRPTFVYQTG